MYSIISYSEIYVMRTDNGVMKRLKPAEDPLDAIFDVVGILVKSVKKHGLRGLVRYCVITKPVVKCVRFGRLK